MSPEYAILGFLNSKPLSFPDLLKAFQASVNHFFNISEQELKELLITLHEKGWIVETAEGNGLYRTSKEGTDEMVSWLLEQHGVEVPKVPWLVKVFFSSHLSDQEVIDIFTKMTHNIRERLDQFERSDNQVKLSYPPDMSCREIFFRELTLDYGYMINHSILIWLEAVISQISSREYEKI